MKHVFIINPAAGKDRDKKTLEQKIISAGEKCGIDYEIYYTKGEKDASVYTKKVCGEYESVRLYACGGDGTVNEVVSAAVEFDNCSVACVPCGTGNDFVKNFENSEDFLDIEALIFGEEKEIDVLKAGDTYCINICNMGFDADVADNVVKFKRLPLVSGALAYSLSVIWCMLKKIGFKAKVTVDNGVKEIKCKVMLMVAANGICYGGGYYGTPEAKVDDGLIDLCIVKKISRFKIASLISYYKKGKHINNPKFDKIVSFMRCKSVKIESNKGFSFCTDGEVRKVKSEEVFISDRKLKLCLPQRISLFKEKGRNEENEGAVCIG